MLEKLFFLYIAPNRTETEIRAIRTISIINILFVVILSIDIIACLFTKQWLLMFSSVYLVIALLFSRILIANNQLEQASIAIISAFLLDAVYHTWFLENIIVAYFILLLSPILSTLIIDRLEPKIIILFCASILFLACNYIVGYDLFENYLFFIGLYPSFLGTLYFYNRLSRLEAEQKKLIDKLEVKNNEVLLFSQMMSHDLKAPLRNIKSFSDLLKRKIDPQKVDEIEYLRFIIEGTNSMTILIEDLLVYSKASSDIYLFETIVLEDLIERQKVAFRFEIEQQKLIIQNKNLGTIVGYEGSMKILFQNLISNAVKYQSIHKENHIPTIVIEHQQDNHYHHIRFGDNGIGIGKENLPYLFEPFRRFHARSQYEGTGLGMSICKKIVDKHHGDISVVSTSENGTTFLIKIPKNLK